MRSKILSTRDPASLSQKRHAAAFDPGRKQSSLLARCLNVLRVLSQRAGSNRGPFPYHGNALPTELRWQNFTLTIIYHYFKYSQ